MNTRFYSDLFNKFDKGLQQQLDGFKRAMTQKMNDIELKLAHCEGSLNTLVKKLQQNFEKELVVAETLVNKELRSKVIMSQWTNKFLAAEEQAVIDPITFAISRYALNVAISYVDITPAYLMETRVHTSLIHFISLPYNLIIGPSLLALSHISLNPIMKKILVSEQLLPALLKLMVKSRSKVILALCAKICASLTLETSNKPFMAQSGCFHALFDLILGAHTDVDWMVQYYVVCAIENTIYHNDSNRRLTIEVHGIKPLLTLVQTTSHDEILIHSMRIIANVAYGNGFTSNSMLLLGAGEVLIQTVDACDVIKQAVIVHGALSAYANMCYTESNQTHVGNIDGLLQSVIRITRTAK
jgi:hypothetical protein